VSTSSFQLNLKLCNDMIERTVRGTAKPDSATLTFNFLRPSGWVENSILNENDRAIREQMQVIVL
jgi:hypothetical protein